MSDAQKNEGVVYRCPMCLNTLNDVTIDVDKDGIYRCLKCGFNGTYEELTERYREFRSRYKLMKTRLTIDVQREM